MQGHIVSSTGSSLTDYKYCIAMSVMKDSFENFHVFLDAEVDTGWFLSEDFKSLADKVEDDDNRAIRKIRVRFSIKKDYFKMPRSFYM